MFNQKTVKTRTVFCRDNLEIMHGLNDEFIDLIYLDPPFNKGRHFHAPIGSHAEGASFQDIWDERDTKEEWHGLIAEKHPRLYTYLSGAGAAGSKSSKYYLIYMAVRILEMHRILKPTGSLYLHCDPTASHYLKLLLDAIFGHRNFRNEIIWKRTSSHSDARTMGAFHDVILLYTKTDKFFWNKQYAPYEPDYIAQRFKHADADGRKWMNDNLSAKGLSGGGYEYVYKGAQSIWRVPKEKMKELDANNRLYFTSKGGIRIKRYLDKMKGVLLGDVWADISPINARAKERQGYPTQKPLALLERIVAASCPEFGIVLDPFCGCATTCVGAERQQRVWLGIDISSKAYELVQRRMKEEVPEDLLTALFEVHFRLDIPQRTDDGTFIIPETKIHKHLLYGFQEGHCAGCAHRFDYQHMELDYIVPRKKGGGDNEENLQLLCGSCNRIKGDRDMAYLKKRLKELVSISV